METEFIKVPWLSLLSFAGAPQVSQPAPPQSFVGPLAGLPLRRAPHITSPTAASKNPVHYLGCLVPTCCECNILELLSSCFFAREHTRIVALNFCLYLFLVLSTFGVSTQDDPPTTIHNLLLLFTAIVTCCNRPSASPAKASTAKSKGLADLPKLVEEGPMGGTSWDMLGPLDAIGCQLGDGESCSHLSLLILKPPGQDRDDEAAEEEFPKKARCL